MLCLSVSAVLCQARIFSCASELGNVISLVSVHYIYLLHRRAKRTNQIGPYGWEIYRYSTPDTGHGQWVCSYG